MKRRNVFRWVILGGILVLLASGGMYWRELLVSVYLPGLKSPDPSEREETLERIIGLSGQSDRIHRRLFKHYLETGNEDVARALGGICSRQMYHRLAAHVILKDITLNSGVDSLGNWLKAGSKKLPVLKTRPGATLRIEVDSKSFYVEGRTEKFRLDLFDLTRGGLLNSGRFENIRGMWETWTMRGTVLKSAAPGRHVVYVRFSVDENDKPVSPPDEYIEEFERELFILEVLEPRPPQINLK